MNDAILMVARAESPVDCVPPPFAPLARPCLWVAFLVIDERYLGDVNDDPGLEDAFDAGLELWATWVKNLRDILTRQYGGTTTCVVVSGRTAQIWTMGQDSTVDRDQIAGLTTYGNVAALWSSAIAPVEASAGVLSLEKVLAHSPSAWWMSHGYKEPFVVGYTPNIGLAELVELIRDKTEDPVQESLELFVPHRIRIHRRFS